MMMLSIVNMWKSRSSVVVATAALLWVSMMSSSVNAVPGGYIHEDFDNDPDVMDIVFFPKFDGSGTGMFSIKKDGQVVVYPQPEAEDDYDEHYRVLNIRGITCDDYERGMLSGAVHPQFSRANPYIYLYYSHRGSAGCPEDDPVGGPQDRVSRFVVDEDYWIDEDSELVIFRTPPQIMDTHNGGDMQFGNDGYLYVSIGDGGTRPNYESQRPHRLLGKLLRFDPDGGIPPSNPFVNAPNKASCKVTGFAPEGRVCEEIYASGLRNPFRMSVNPNVAETQIFISDVGRGTWEEINEAGTNFPGRNYGWMIREGPCDFGSLTRDCQAGQDVAIDADSGVAFTNPTHFYNHRVRNDGGAAIIGGAFPPRGYWPIPADSYMIADYVFGEIYNLIPDADNACPDCDIPTSPWRNETFHTLEDGDRPVTLKFAPHQGNVALYYTCLRCNPNIKRIRYVGGTNAAPEADISVDNPTGIMGSVFSFDGSASFDPEGGDLTYLWDFGDGTQSNAVTPQKTYAVTGNLVVTLTVTDVVGAQNVARIEIFVGANAEAFIDLPVEGTTFAVGDILTLVGHAFDSTGAPMTDDQLFWEVRQHHNSHYHTFLAETPGNNLIIDPAPRPEDFHAATNSYLEIILSVSDPISGVRTEINRVVLPQIIQIQFESDPPFLNIEVDGYKATAPSLGTFWVNEELHFHAAEIAGFAFEGWSSVGLADTAIGAGTDVQFVVTPGANNTVVKANFRPMGGALKIPSSITLLQKFERILPGAPVITDAIVMNLQPDGNLQLFQRASGVLLWESDVRGEADSYFGTIQGDCNFVVFEGTPDEPGPYLWKTQTIATEAACFLAAFPYQEKIALLEGTIEVITGSFWEQTIVFPMPPTAAPSPSPTPAPSPEPSLPPTPEPTPAPFAAPSSSPTALRRAPVPSPTEPLQEFGEDMDSSASSILSRLLVLSATTLVALVMV